MTLDEVREDYAPHEVMHDGAVEVSEGRYQTLVVHDAAEDCVVISQYNPTLEDHDDIVVIPRCLLRDIAKQLEVH